MFAKIDLRNGEPRRDVLSFRGERETSVDSSTRPLPGKIPPLTFRFTLTKVAIRRAQARARLTTFAILAAFRDVSKMDWDLIEDPAFSPSFRIVPGRTLSRFIAGINIRHLDDYARELLAEALVGRVSHLQTAVISARVATRPGDGSTSHRMAVAKEFVLRRLHDEFSRCGLNGLLALCARPGSAPLAIGRSADGVILGIDTFVIPEAQPERFEAGDPLARGLTAQSIPDAKLLAKAAAYVCKLGWPVARGAKGGWVVQPGAQFARYAAGGLATTPANIARTVVARAIRRIVPISTQAITATMRWNVDPERAAVVQRLICDRIAHVVRTQGYAGLRALAGVAS